MPRKSTKSKSHAPRRKTTITVRGGIKAGRDVIMGDQHAYYDYRKQIARIASPAEFTAELQKLREQIAALKAQPALLPAQVQTLEFAQEQIEQSVAESQEPQPLAARVKGTLDGAKSAMDSLKGGVSSAVELGKALAAFGSLALKLFGGG
jgi:hypothetical protein